MSSISYAASSVPPPLSRLHASQNTGLNHARPARELNNLQLSLKNVIGTTTNSVNAFDALPGHHSFVCCAGSAAVLSRVDEHLNISQQFFRAKLDASPINATPSFYNPATPPITPGKNRRESPFRDEGSRTIYNGSHNYPPNSPCQGRANNPNRETSCVSLSRGGDLMAIGEVNRLTPSFAFN